MEMDWQRIGVVSRLSNLSIIRSNGVSAASARRGSDRVRIAGARF